MKKIFVTFFSILFFVPFLFSDTPDNLVSFNSYKVIYQSQERKIYVKLYFVIEEGWHINSHTPLDDYFIPAQLILDDHPAFSVEAIYYPDPHLVTLESLGGKSSVFDGSLEIELILKNIRDVYEKTDLTGRILYQGCNNAICLIPMETHFTIPFDLLMIQPRFSEDDGDSPLPITTSPASPTQPAIDETQISGNFVPTESLDTSEEKNPFASRSFILGLLFAFLGGLALNLTPCVYPLIPVTISYFGSQKSTGKPLVLAILYVLGMAITYSLLGTIAALTGSLFGSLMANPIVLVLLALLMIILALSMFGVYEIQLPYALTQKGGSSRLGYWGALIMGLTMGIVAAPCIGPFVISLLTYVATVGNPLIGFLLFFSMSIGLGVPYIFLVIFSSQLKTLPRSGEWLNGVRIFFGLILLGMAIFFIQPLLNPFLSKILFPLYLILAGIYYAIFNHAGETSPGFRKVKLVLSFLTVIAGIWLIKPDVTAQKDLTWHSYSKAILQKANEEDRFVMIDFFSESCIPCKELDANTFSDPQVREILKAFTLIKVDLTRKNQELIEKYNIRGFPTVIFLDPDGYELQNYRLLGYENPHNFLKRLQNVINQK